MRRNVAILGSTGSIGRSTLDVIRHLGPPYRAIALAARCSVAELVEQARSHQVGCLGLADESALQALRETGIADPFRLYMGNDGLSEMVCRDDVDIVVAAAVGCGSLRPVCAAIRAGKTIALANKETLVAAGAVMTADAQRFGAVMLPIDSEHSAVFQAMQAGRLDEVRQVVLTASGGPFRTWEPSAMERATAQDALRHPTWSMGRKVTIDSATMFNKGLEVIEACWLFGLRPDQIRVMIHPESVIHSMVEFVDGSVLAQLSPPDMRTPIQYALTFPRRLEGNSARMDWTSAGALHLEPPDHDRFPALELAFEAARAGGSAGAVLNAANEIAVEAFLDGRIRFGMIWRVVERTMRKRPVQPVTSLDDVLEADRQARADAVSVLRELSSG